ncbi:hypothetical protein IU450_04835 [Nocardia abscessus]|uniref:hypothetical protein n=1 Tax=Nocardia TaxID=1817 RepID=UPI001896000F|nr:MULTISPECIES: hypothetical protein [Nocardia]MBF6335206.1 hypothetical protein [Nocardia abscessus]MDE1671589.1 hypothetical protein [Nocardia gipuzkoensis]
MSNTSEQSWNTLVNIEDVPQVDELYNFVGILEDMKFVAEAFDQLAELTREDGDDEPWVHRQALFSAAVIAYARCFGSGVRGKLEVSALDQLPQSEPGAARKMHKFVCDMRDKHVAHSVSPFEAVMVGGLFHAEEGQTDPSAAVGWLTIRGLPLGVELALGLRDLARCWVNYLDVQIKLVQEKVMASLKNEDPEVFAKRPPIQYTVPSPDDAGIPRRFGRGISPL